MKIAIIGDVHGCAAEYDQLLRIVRPKVDLVVQLGDLLHKGPESAACVDLSVANVDIQLFGNHEHKHFRWLKNLKSNTTHTMQNINGYEDVQLDWFQEQYLFQSRLAFAFDDFMVIHAGVPSNCSASYKKITNTEYRLSEKVPEEFKTSLFLRYEDERKKSVNYGNEKPTDCFWASEYRGQVGHVVFGHQPHPCVTHYPWATAIDTCCVYGGKLTALVIEDNQIVDTVYVKAQQVYYQKENQ